MNKSNKKDWIAWEGKGIPDINEKIWVEIKNNHGDITLGTVDMFLWRQIVAYRIYEEQVRIHYEIDGWTHLCFKERERDSIPTQSQCDIR